MPSAGKTPVSCPVCNLFVVASFPVKHSNSRIMKITQNWNQATIIALRDLSPTVRQFDIAPLNGDAQVDASTYPPGAHLQVQVMANFHGDGQSGGNRLQTRSYSLIGAPNPKAWRIAVKRMDEGRGGSRAMWRLAVGDRLMTSEPQNLFALDLTAPGYLVVAGGIGITPLVGMVQRLADRARATGVPLRVLYGARTEQELVFAADLQAALMGLPGKPLQLHSGSALIDFAGEIAALPTGAQLYTCGPVPMLEALKVAWQAAGRPQSDLRFETFGSSGRLPTQAFRLAVPRHGIDIEVPPGSTLLEALEAAGVPTISDCRRGECGLCAMDVISVQGEIDHRDVFLSAHEKAECKRLCVCVSRAVGTVTLDSSWRPD
jgi:ferredoxin-NADP reductase